MKVVILAGGFGTRISEESHLRPKPMIEIGGRPILWHIMKYFSHFGFNDFIICLGYKGYMIKEYFADYYLHTSDITFDFTNHNCIEVHNNYADPWKVTLIDTGLETMTGGRIQRVQKYIGNETFMLTYGDGVSDLDLCMLAKFHKEHGKLATLTAIQPKGRFGVLDIGDAHQISSFLEKPQQDNGWINGGFMILEPQVIDYIEGDCTMFEREPLERLSKEGQLYAFQHRGFWQCMDTQRDKNMLESLIEAKKAPWMVW
jgi:glucose-1-phosphate cytidylyltransferase